MKTEIAQWLIQETDERGWSFRELGRRASLSSSTISKVITGERLPGWEFCRKVARAFQVPPESVFRLAGLLPPKPEETALGQEMIYLFSQLSLEDQERLIVFVRSLIASGPKQDGAERSRTLSKRQMHS